jgi:hypothetical protein
MELWSVCLFFMNLFCVPVCLHFMNLFCVHVIIPQNEGYMPSKGSCDPGAVSSPVHVRSY